MGGRNPYFLKVLELDGEADERSIRRAYARKLKQVDQEADPAGFQRLREAYEAALAWTLRAQSQQVELTTGEGPHQYETDILVDAPPPIVQATAEPQEDPLELAAAVMDDFDTASAPLINDPAALAGELKRVLADPRLFSFDARIAFEQIIAERLTSGWQPGHQYLFPAAVECFGWAQDRRRLLELGPAGEMLDRAVDEADMFELQPAKDRALLRPVIAMLQSPVPAPRRLVRKRAAQIAQLHQRFPTLISVIANTGSAEHWEEFYESPKPKLSIGWGGGRAAWFVFMLVFGVARMAFQFSSHPSPAPDYRGPGSGGAQHRPFEPPQRPISPAEIDEIRSRIHYKPGPGIKEGTSYVIYDVFLDAGGKPFAMNRIEWSGDPAYHEAVKRAILETKPFPPGTRTMFRLGYQVELRRRPAARTPRPAQAQAAPSAPGDGPGQDL